ncbi:molybdopterin-dependent oxidoreductase, partial [Escherichia coli]
VIVADHQQTATTAKAHLVLPAASFAEGDGTLVSQEGRAQRFFQVFDPTYY